MERRHSRHDDDEIIIIRGMRKREAASERSLIRRFNSININNSLALNAHNEPMTNVAKSC